MAKVEKQSDDLLMANESPLAKAQAAKYVDNQKTASFYSKISDYMFWGATSILGALAVGIMTAGIGSIGAPLLIGGGLASAATFVGSVFFGEKSTEISERSNVLYSDIDSQNQARRMVQAFAKAQASEVDTQNNKHNDTLFTNDEKSSKNWAAHVGGAKANHAETWQSRIAEQAEREDALAMQNLSR